MSSAAEALTRSERSQRGPAIDGPTLVLTLALLLLGLTMVTSASITIAGRDGAPFAFLERQLILVLMGAVAAALTFSIPTEKLERFASPLLLIALALLVVVLGPGLGHVVNGSRRWLHVAGLNFQVSEAARVLALIYIASYSVRYEADLRGGLSGVARPLGLLAGIALLLLLDPDFGAGCVLFLTGFGVLFLAGAQWRWILATVLTAGGAMWLLVRFSPYRLQRLLTFMN